MRSLQKSARSVNQKDQQRTAAQADLVISLLRQAGASGISKRDFITGAGLLQGRMITQVSARVYELEEVGYQIEHRREAGTDFVRFVLISEPSGQPPTQIPLRLSAAAISEFSERERGAR